MEDTKQISTDAIRERLETVRERIEHACQRAGRRSEEITIVAVTKTFPLEATKIARDLGLRHFGENRARQLRDKARELPGAFNGGDIHWHMIGHLQRNKAKYIARHADFFQALDSPRLAEELNDRAAKNDRVMPCFVQVNISGADQKYGVAPEEVHDFFDHLADHSHLKIQGLMAMASFVDDPEEVRPEFKRARDLFDRYNAQGNPRVRMEDLSIGMSNDFEVAIEEGSTQIRLGSSLFGPRD